MRGAEDRSAALVASIHAEGVVPRASLVLASREVCAVTESSDSSPPRPLPRGYVEALVLALGGGVRSVKERLGLLALLVHLVRERGAEESYDAAASWYCSTCTFSNIDAAASTCALCGDAVERDDSLTGRLEALVDRPHCAATDGAMVLAAFERHCGYSALEVLVIEAIAADGAGDEPLVPRTLRLVGALTFLGAVLPEVAVPTLPMSPRHRAPTSSRFGRRRVRNVEAFRVLSDFLARLAQQKQRAVTSDEMPSAPVIGAVVRWTCDVLSAHADNTELVRQLHPIASMIDAMDVLSADAHAARAGVIAVLLLLVRSQPTIPMQELGTLCAVVLGPVQLTTLDSALAAIEDVLKIRPAYLGDLVTMGLYDALSAWLRLAVEALEVAEEEDEVASTTTTTTTLVGSEAEKSDASTDAASVGTAQRHGFLAEAGDWASRESVAPSTLHRNARTPSLRDSMLTELSAPAANTLVPVLRCVCALLRRTNDGVVAALERAGCFHWIWRALCCRAIDANPALCTALTAVIDSAFHAVLRPTTITGRAMKLDTIMRGTVAASRRAMQRARFDCAEAILEVISKRMMQDCDGAGDVTGIPEHTRDADGVVDSVVACQDAFARAGGFDLASHALARVVGTTSRRSSGAVGGAIARARKCASLGIAITFLYSVATAFHRPNGARLRRCGELRKLGEYIVAAVQAVRRANGSSGVAESGATLSSVCAALDSLAMNGRVLPLSIEERVGDDGAERRRRPWISVPEALLLQIELALVLDPPRIGAIVAKAEFLAATAHNQAALASARGAEILLKRLLLANRSSVACEELAVGSAVFESAVHLTTLVASHGITSSLLHTWLERIDDDAVRRWRLVDVLVRAATHGARRDSARGTGTGRPVAAMHFKLGSAPSAAIYAEGASNGEERIRRGDAVWPPGAANGYTLSAWIRVESWHQRSAAAPKLCLLQVQGSGSASSMVEIRVNCVSGDPTCGVVQLVTRRGATFRSDVVFGEFQLALNVWTHITVTHAKPQALRNKSAASLIINGKLVSQIMKVAYPQPSRISHLLVGAIAERSARPAAVPLLASALCWALGPTYLLGQLVSVDAIASLVTLGVSYDGLFSGCDGQGTELVTACEAGLFNPPTLHSMLSNMDGTSEAMVRVRLPLDASNIIMALSSTRFMHWGSPRWTPELGEKIGELNSAGSTLIDRISMFGGVALSLPRLISSAAQTLCCAAPLTVHLLKEATSSAQLVSALRFIAVLCAGDVDSTYSMESSHAFSSAAQIMREKQDLLNREALDVVFACVLGRAPPLDSLPSHEQPARSRTPRCPLIIANLAAAEHLLLCFDLWQGAQEGLQGVMFGWLLDAVGGFERHVNLAQLRRLNLVQRLLSYVTQSELPDVMFADARALLRMCLVGPDANAKEQRRRFALVAGTCVALMMEARSGTRLVTAMAVGDGGGGLLSAPWRTRLLENLLQLLVEVATLESDEGVRKALFDAMDYELLFVLINGRDAHARASALAFTLLRALVVLPAKAPTFVRLDGYNKLGEVLPCSSPAPDSLRDVYRRLWVMIIGEVRDEGPKSRDATVAWLEEACKLGNVDSLNLKAVGTLLDLTARVVASAGADAARAPVGSGTDLDIAAEALGILATMYDISAGFCAAWKQMDRNFGTTGPVLFAKLMNLLRSTQEYDVLVSGDEDASPIESKTESALGVLVRAAATLVSLRLDEMLTRDVLALPRLDAVLQDGMDASTSNHILRMLLVRGRGEEDEWPKWSGNLLINIEFCRVAVQHLARSPPAVGATLSKATPEHELALLLLNFIVDLIDVAEAQEKVRGIRKKKKEAPLNAPLLVILDVAVAWSFDQTAAPWEWRANVLEVLLARRDHVFAPRSTSTDERRSVATLCRGFLHSYVESLDVASEEAGGSGSGSGSGSGEGSPLAVASLVDVLMMELLQRKETSVAEVMMLFIEVADASVGKGGEPSRSRARTRSSSEGDTETETTEDGEDVAASVDEAQRVHVLLEAHLKAPASGTVKKGRGLRRWAVAGAAPILSTLEEGRTKVMQADVFTFMLAPVLWQADTMASAVDALPQPRSEAFIRESLAKTLGTADGALLASMLDRHLSAIGWNQSSVAGFKGASATKKRRQQLSKLRDKWLLACTSAEARHAFKFSLASRFTRACDQETQQLQEELQHLLDRSTFAKRRCEILDDEFMQLYVDEDGLAHGEIALSEGEGPCRMRTKLTTHPKLELRRRVTVNTTVEDMPVKHVAEHTLEDKSSAAAAVAAEELHQELEGGGDDETEEDKDADDGPDIDEKLRPLLTLGDEVEFQCNCSRITPNQTSPATFLMCRNVSDGSKQGYLVSNYLLADGDERRGASLSSRVAEATLENRPGALHFEEQPDAAPPPSSASIEHRCIKWSFDDVRAIYSRRYLLRQIALEFFLLDGSTHLVVFASGELRDFVRTSLISRCRPTVQSNPEAVHKAALKAWLEGKISNFEYLMDLNTTSGRSFNDLTQYPVFPWILADYDSDTLDLTKSETFRDLSKPLGAMSPDRAETFRERYLALVEPPPLGTPASGTPTGVRRSLSASRGVLQRVANHLTAARPRARSGDVKIDGKTSPPPFWRRRARSSAAEEWGDGTGASAPGAMGMPPPFHYGTHYSSAAVVLHYMLRLQPYAQQHVQLQGGKFDQADRLFGDVGAAWRSAAGLAAGGHALQDVKELIPEFFCMPSFLSNVNAYDLGTTASGAEIGDVVLPPWARGSSREFIRVHRQALESEHVSTHLHKWIDLIFGFKQRGQAAIDAINVFYWLTYEDRVDLDAIEDPNLRRAYVEQIHEFGQTPTQLFTRPHPKRKVIPRAEAAAGAVHAAPHRLVATLVRSAEAPIVALGEQRLRSGRSGLVAVAGAAKGCALRTPLRTEAVLWGGGDVVEFSDNTEEGNVGYALPDELCVCEVRIGSGGARAAPQRCELASVHEGLHAGGVSAACVTETGETLVTGGRDGAIRVWSLRAARRARRARTFAKSVSGGWRGLLQKEMSTVLCGHRAPLRFVAASESFSVLISSSADGECILWDLWSRRLVRRLDTGGVAVSALAVDSDTGRCIVCAGTLLFVRDVNGDCIANVDVAVAKGSGRGSAEWKITACTHSSGDPWDRNNVIVTGHANGAVLMWSIELAVVSAAVDVDAPPVPPRTPRSSPTNSGGGSGGARSRSRSRSLSSSNVEWRAPPGASHLVLRRSERVHAVAVTALYVSDDQQRLFSGDRAGKVVRWEVA